MAASVDNESEILLGNKQLLAVFAVVAILLAVAFGGGYMLGKNSAEKKAAGGADAQSAAAAGDGAPALVPHTVTPEDQAPGQTPEKDTAAPSRPEPRPAGKVVTPPGAGKQPVYSEAEPALGSRNPEAPPRAGQSFVQVAALTRPQAEATADVLRKQHFPARIAPKPGSATIFRVLVGPTKDAGDITAKRDALRKIGFRDVIVQHY
jgi:hypothetical protein